MVKAIKSVVNKAVNGHKKTVAAGLVGVLSAAWAVNAQRHIEDEPVLRAEFNKHMEDIPNLTKALVDVTTAEQKALRLHIDDKTEAVENVIATQTEAAGEWRRRNEKDMDRVLTVLDRMDQNINDIRNRLPAKP